MNNVILLKNSDIENKKPTSLAYGEIALNYRDGNIYYKNSAGDIVEMKRLDERLNSINITNMIYDNVTGDLTSITYASGNIVTLNYTNGDLTLVNYYGIDGTTLLFNQTLTYSVGGDLIGTNWSAA